MNEPSTPDARPVLILTGSPGSGKTTVADILARRPGRPAVHLETDTFWHFIKSGYIEPWEPESHTQNITVMRIVAIAASTYAKAGYFTIIDGIVGPRWFLDPLRNAIQLAGVPVAYAVLQVPLDLAVLRAEGRCEGPLKNAKAVQDLWGEFAELGSLQKHVIAVADRTPEEIAGEIDRLLDSGQLSV